MTNEASVSQVKPQLKMGKACNVLSIIFSALGILINFLVINYVTEGMDSAEYNYRWNLENLPNDKWLIDLRLNQYHIAIAFLILIGVSILFYICYICIKNKTIPTTIYSCVFIALNVYLFTKTEYHTFAGVMLGASVVVAALFFFGMKFKLLPCTIVGVVLALLLGLFGFGNFEDFDFGYMGVGIPYLNIVGVASLVLIYGISMSWQKHRIKHPKQPKPITYMQPVTYMQQVPQQQLPTMTQDQIRNQ